jgi:cytochrome c oxidase assembly factor CtaG
VWRLVLGVTGLEVIFLALASPVDDLAHALFVGHMAQHMLLIMVAAPALLLADPFPVVLWSLPVVLRHRAGRWLAPGSVLRRGGRAITAMPVAWLAYAVALWVWHLPPLYDAALRHAVVHDVEHLTFFAAALLFWWPVIHPAPRLRAPSPIGLRVVYIVLAGFQSAALGLLLALSPIPLYTSYAAPSGEVWLSPLEDQAWGGAVMWGVTGVVDMVAVGLLLARLFDGGTGGRRAAAASLTAPNPCGTMSRFDE